MQQNALLLNREVHTFLGKYYMDFGALVMLLFLTQVLVIESVSFFGN